MTERKEYKAGRGEGMESGSRQQITGAGGIFGEGQGRVRNQQSHTRVS